MKRLSAKIILEITVTIITLLSGIIFLIDYYKDKQTKDISGAWKFTFTIKESAMPKYIGMTAGYKIYITQEGKKIKGKGEKFWVNSKEIPSLQHDPLTFEGQIEDGVLKAQYELSGVKRNSFGEFTVNVNEDSEVTLIQGSFCGSAANTKGEVTASKE